MLPFLLTATFSMPLQISAGHIIPASQGQQMILAYRIAKAANGPTFSPIPQDWDAIACSIGAIRRLMEQPGAVSVRWYQALNGSRHTLVSVAVDAMGKDIDGATAVMIDNGASCPPLCG